MDYQAMEQYAFSADGAVTEHVLGPDGSSIGGTSPANNFYLPPLLMDVVPVSPTDGDGSLPLYLLYGMLLFYDHFTGFA